MCNSGPTWKREVVPDHKFDFIDTREFTDNGCGMRSKYIWLYVIVLKDFLVYVFDIFTAITMLSSKTWSNEIFNSCTGDRHDCVPIPFDVGKWIFVGCIIFSFLLLAYEGHKAKKIIASRDISYAFTNIMANNYYSLRSYDHFCFFSHISDSTKRIDDFAFFVFFTFKSWKRVLLADGPRQSINALTLYSFFIVKQGYDKNHVQQPPWWYIDKYFSGSVVASALIVSTLVTVVLFAGSLLLLIGAGVCYIPLLFHIQGNLKEYCCYKVDKRISEIIVRRNKQRMAEASELTKKEAAGDFSHLKGGKPLPQPTLPNLSVEDEFDDASSMRTRGPPGSTFTGKSDMYYGENAGYPAMPAYNQPYSHHQDGYGQYNGSVPNVYDEHQMYDDETGSTAHLTLGAAPFGQGYSAQDGYGAHGYVADPHAVYYGEYDQTRSAAHTPVQYQGYEQDRAASHTPIPHHVADVYGHPQHQQYYSHGDGNGGYGGHAL